MYRYYYIFLLVGANHLTMPDSHAPTILQGQFKTTRHIEAGQSQLQDLIVKPICSLSTELRDTLDMVCFATPDGKLTLNVIELQDGIPTLIYSESHTRDGAYTRQISGYIGNRVAERTKTLPPDHAKSTIQDTLMALHSVYRADELPLFVSETAVRLLSETTDIEASPGDTAWPLTITIRKATGHFEYSLAYTMSASEKRGFVDAYEETFDSAIQVGAADWDYLTRQWLDLYTQTAR